MLVFGVGWWVNLVPDVSVAFVFTTTWGILFMAIINLIYIMASIQNGKWQHHTLLCMILYVFKFKLPSRFLSMIK
jgi:hypothetical protein